jgi:hypothetical protein
MKMTIASWPAHPRRQEYPWHAQTLCGLCALCGEKADYENELGMTDKSSVLIRVIRGQKTLGTSF